MQTRVCMHVSLIILDCDVIFCQVFVTYTYFEELRWPKPSHPHEATFSWSLPHTRNKMKDIRFCKHTLEVHYLVVMCYTIVDIDSKLVFQKMLLHCVSKLAHQSMVFLQPPRILHVENCSIYIIQAKSTPQKYFKHPKKKFNFYTLLVYKNFYTGYLKR